MLSLANYIHKTPITNTPKTMVNSRLSWVDHARGFAIMLVVYRHSVVGMRRSGINVSPFMYNLQEVFYNFRMPVFFVLSGIFVAGSLQKKSRTSLLKDRVLTVLYPYVLWGTIMILLQVVFSQFTNAKRNWIDLANIIIQPREVDHLWYLFALFNTSVLYLLFNKLIRNTAVHAALAVVLNLISISAFFQGNSLLADILYFYCYFFAGTLISSTLLVKEKREKFLNPAHLKWVLPLFAIGQWFWFIHRNEEKIYMPLFLAINLFACYFIYVISFRSSLNNKNQWLSYLGKHSLYIYILHVFITSSARNLIFYIDPAINPWALLFICWLGGLMVPVILFNLLKKFGFEKLFSLKPKVKE